jgi:hypothetical protein
MAVNATLLALALAGKSFVPYYHVEFLPDNRKIWYTGINDRNDAVGGTDDGGLAVYKAGKLTYIPRPDDPSTYFAPMDIANDGTIYGYWGSDYFRYPVVWRKGSPTFERLRLPDDRYHVATLRPITNDGAAAGAAALGDRTRPVIYERDRTIELGFLEGRLPVVETLGMNEARWVVGYFNTREGGNPVGFLRTPESGVAQPFPHIAAPEDVNDNGEIVGVKWYYNTKTSELRELDNMRQAKFINNAGVIVGGGRAINSGGVVVHNFRTYRLIDLVDQRLGYTSVYPVVDLNEKGVILAGVNRRDGTGGAALLIPRWKGPFAIDGP